MDGDEWGADFRGFSRIWRIAADDDGNWERTTQFVMPPMLICVNPFNPRKSASYSWNARLI
jgi:hypothetical protein